jgi:hypothetical protein
MGIVKIEKPLNEIHWEDASDYQIKAGISIEKPVPVFKKFKLKDMLSEFKKLRESKGLSFDIPESVVEIFSEESKPKEKKKKKKDQSGNMISYKFFQKFRFRTARIIAIDRVKSDKKQRLPLFSFELSFGRGIRRKTYYLQSDMNLSQLRSYSQKDVVYLSNLDSLPAEEIFFKDQNHLILHAKDSKKTVLLVIVDEQVPLGSIIR